MNDIYVVVSAIGTITWQNTQLVVATQLCNGLEDYGLVSATSVTCDGCRMELPWAVCRLEQIVPEELYLVVGRRIVALNSVTLDISETYEVVLGEDEAFVIAKDSPAYIGQNKPKPIAIHTLWMNDIANLHYVCATCDRARDGRTWAEWKGSDKAPTPLLGAPAQVLG